MSIGGMFLLSNTTEQKYAAFIIEVATFACESSSASPAGACANISAVLIHARCT